jgi:hypothetical protein
MFGMGKSGRAVRGQGGGTGRMGGRLAAGPGGECVCPNCGIVNPIDGGTLLPGQVSAMWGAPGA